MKKGQLPIFAELTLADTKDFTVKVTKKFAGTDNPRALRVIHALMLGPCTRNQIDSIAGAANGPDLMKHLRDLGISEKARYVPAIDRDGYPIRPGIYEFDDADRCAVRIWQRKRDTAAKAKS